MAKKYDVGILGWWYGKNYGSILTYFGLNRTITKLGYSVLMVHEATGYNKWRIKWPKNIVSVEFAKRVGYNMAPQTDFSELPHLNEEVDTFVVGSDQLWNPMIGRVNDDLFLDFVSPENRRIAYATSFGNRNTGKFQADFIQKHKENLQKFEAISVREKYAVDIAEATFGVDATQVVDPVFLLETDEYIELADKAEISPQGDFLVTFFLDLTPSKRVVAEAIADKLKLNKIFVIPNPDGGRELATKIFEGDRFEILAKDAPENFLNAYKNAKYVVTDSFHGTAFSIIFQKPFSSIYNHKRGADRFANLLGSLGFGDTRRVLERDTDQTIKPNPNVSLSIDFTEANKILKIEQRKSLAWLKNALSNKDGFEGASNVKGRLLGSLNAIMTPKDRKNKISLKEPFFETRNNVWDISPLKDATRVSLASQSSEKKGQWVWCHLPFPLQKGSAYRLEIKWSIRSDKKQVNLHILNLSTRKFKVVGAVDTKGRAKSPKVDTLDFLVSEEGFSQIMLGAVHFSGRDTGADIYEISITEIEADQIVAPKKPQRPTPAQVAKVLSEKDHERYIKSYAQNMVSRNDGNARALLMFHSHAIEKGLSRENFRPGFGRISVPGLAVEMNKWTNAGLDRNDSFYQIAASAMHSYLKKHEALNVDVSEFTNQFNSSVLEDIKKTTELLGGVISAHDERESKVVANQDRSFIDVVYERRSVRDFTSEPVSDQAIEKAVLIAMQSPSVCNRQPARVHAFSDRKTISQAIDLQGGFGGYDAPPKLLLVTSDLTAFLFASERNQAFIDGGLFMMSLMLGLEQFGLGSCCLNTAMGTEKEQKLRKLLQIPDNEIFIAFLAVGNHSGEVLTPRSKRLPLEEILRKR